MAGVSGFIGTLLLGPRIGMFKPDKVMQYVFNDQYLDDEEANQLLSELLKDKRNVKEFNETLEDLSVSTVTGTPSV